MSSAFESETRIRPGSLRAWVLACRPATLVASVAPVWVGTACAHAAGEPNWRAAFAALLGATSLQVGANLANDVSDFEKGADTADRLGPARAVQSGWLSARAVRRGMWVAFAFAFVWGVYLTAVAGPVVIAIGVSSILAALAYTAGPYPLGYNGLGELCVLAFFGFAAVAGTAFVELGWVPSSAWWSAPIVGALASAILIVNNVRDLPTDQRSNKRTLVVRFGRRFGVAEYGCCLGVSYAIPVLLVATAVWSPWSLLPLLTLPRALSNWRALGRGEGRALNQTLMRTAQLLFSFSILLGIGLVIGRP